MTSLLIDSKMKIRKQARLSRGILNLLRDDLEMICSDTDAYNLVALDISINETKDTIQRLIDSIMDLEYSLYLIKEERESREKHSHL